MTIAVICDVLGKENNGTTIAAMNLIRSLREKGYDVRVVCSDPERAGQKDFYVVPTLNLGPLNAYVAKNGVALANPDRNILTAALNGVDHVHVMMPFALGSAAARLAHELGLPLTAGFHCQAENFTGHIFMKNFSPANRIAYHVFYRNLYRYCDCIHYPSQFICDTFEAIVGPTQHRIISNGVNQIFQPKPAEKPKELKGRFVVLFTGRYSPEKSHKVLIEAVARSRYKDEIQLIFAGDGPLRQSLARQANRLALNPGGQMSAHCPDIRPPEIERELEIEIEKERELEKGRAAPAVLGRYQNVLLSAGELSELQTDFPTIWQEYIERLSEYMASTGRTYKSHAATIRRWIADDRRKAAPPARDRDYSVKDGDTV